MEGKNEAEKRAEGDSTDNTIKIEVAGSAGTIVVGDNNTIIQTIPEIPNHSESNEQIPPKQNPAGEQIDKVETNHKPKLLIKPTAHLSTTDLIALIGVIVTAIGVIIAFLDWRFPGRTDGKPTPTQSMIAALNASLSTTPDLNLTLTAPPPTASAIPCSPSIAILSPQAGQGIPAQLVKPGINYTFPMDLDYQICDSMNTHWSIFTITETKSPKCLVVNVESLPALSGQSTFTIPVLDKNNLTSIESIPLDFFAHVFLLPSNLINHPNGIAPDCQLDLTDIGVDLASFDPYPNQTLYLKLTKLIQ